jgi:hypothetical protein
MWKYILSWFGLLVIAVLNGTLRQFGYQPWVGELAAHQISVCTFVFFFGAAVWWMLGRWPLRASQRTWVIGCTWLAMTMSFEFLFFHYIRGIAWEVLLHDYNIAQGRLWVLVLAWVAISPRVVWQWRNGQRTER